MKKLIAAPAIGAALLVGMNMVVYGQAKKKPIRIGMIADRRPAGEGACPPLIDFTGERF